MKHESLRPHVETPEELYELLGRLQSIALRDIGWRSIACVGCVAVALIATGVIAKTAICLAVIAGMSWIWSMADFTGRDWAMHALTLHDLVRPRQHSYDSVLGAMIEIEALYQTAGEAAEGQEAGKGEQDATS